VAFRIWQQRLREAEQRAIEAERGRDEAARRQAVEERLHIARELHDSLTHSISVIRVQASVAVHLARKRGEEVPAALQALQEASSDASRIVQEALTNVSRHSGQASACVQVSYEPAAVTVRVDDDGHGTNGQPLAPGLGITGMRERATALGGELARGPTARRRLLDAGQPAAAGAGMIRVRAGLPPRAPA
jgi:signal transduction histidine kinase